jgi:hypothetical protein
MAAHATAGPVPLTPGARAPIATATTTGRSFALVSLAVAASACLIAGWAPIGFSIVTVFLFAGPHNWMEARYFLSRMPARWGPLRRYFSTGIAGVVLLTGAFAALGSWSNELSLEGWRLALAIWNTVFVCWVLLLIRMRSRQHPRRRWDWAIPAGFALMAVAWLWPEHWDLGLVYAHPLVALCFLDRELKLRRPHWRRAYHRSLVGVAGLVAVLWWRLADSPSLPGDDALTVRIAGHAGAHLLSGVSSHLLVATHTFLEMLHYGVWVVAAPIVGLRGTPWQLGDVPLCRRSPRWRAVVMAVLCLGALAVLMLWAGLLADYPLTRDIYFTVAMLHVLAEVPFLLRAL